MIDISASVFQFRIAETRREAEASIDLMRERFARIRSDEEAKGGLVIVAAVYGKMEAPAGFAGGTESSVTN